MRDRMTPQARTLVKLIVVLPLVGVVATVIAAKAEGATTKTLKPYPVPCRSCTYWTTGAATRTVDGTAVTIRGFAEHVVYRDGRDHIRNIAWSGETAYGPLAFDRVAANLRISRGGPRITDTWTWDPAPRWGQVYVGRNRKPGRTNGRTVYGVDLAVAASWQGVPLRLVVTPSDVVEGEIQAARLRTALAGR
jgi:hypothetical protein